MIGISIEKEALKDQINQRVDDMIQKGLVDEVNYLMKKYGINAPAFKAIGYKEVIQHLSHSMDKDNDSYHQNTHFSMPATNDLV